MKTVSLLGLLLAAGVLRAEVSLPPGPAAITLTPSGVDAMVITAPEGGPAPAPSTLTVENSGDGKLNWSASADAAWIKIGQTSGTLNKTGSIGLAITVDLTGLVANDYHGTITVSDPGASNSPQKCGVLLHVLKAPKVGVSPSSVSWTVPDGTLNTPGQIVTVQNVGGGSLTWAGSSDVPWLSASPNGGTLTAGASMDVTLSVNLAGQSIGTVGGHWTPTSAQDPSPPSVTASLTISPVPVIHLTPTSLTFDTAQGSNPPAQIVTLSNEGSGSLNWQVLPDPAATWLQVSPLGPAALGSGNNQPLTFTASGASGLTEGTYLATIKVTSTNASNSPQLVSVTLNVNASPKIGLNPDSLHFEVSQDQPGSAPAPVSITNSGFGTLVWGASCPAGWVSISPLGGELGALGSQAFLLSASGAGLAPGTYTTTVQISGTNKDPGGGAVLNSPQTISIKLQVDPSADPVHAPAGQCGLLGLEALIPAALALLRRRRSLRRT
jgi:hypothetical protein